MCEVWPDTVVNSLLNELDDCPRYMWPRLAEFLTSNKQSMLARRSQLEYLVSLVEPSAKLKLVDKLRVDSTFLATVNELKATSDLLLRGIRLEYDYKCDKKTPDWTVIDGNSNPTAIIEVTTCTTSEAATSFCRLWNCFNKASINSDRIVQVRQPKYQRKWKCKEIIACIEKVRAWCEQVQRVEGDQIEDHGVQFAIGGERQPGTDISPGILDRVNPKSSADLYSAIENKILSYEDICQDHKLPLVVVIYNDDEWVSASFEDWLVALTGNVLQINQQITSVVCPQSQAIHPGGLFTDRPLLSAAGWLVKNEGWHTNWLINPKPTHPIDRKLLCG